MGTTNAQRIDLALKMQSRDVISPMHCETGLINYRKDVMSSRHLWCNYAFVYFLGVGILIILTLDICTLSTEIFVSLTRNLSKKSLIFFLIWFSDYRFGFRLNLNERGIVEAMPFIILIWLSGVRIPAEVLSCRSPVIRVIIHQLEFIRREKRREVWGWHRRHCSSSMNSCDVIKKPNDVIPCDLILLILVTFFYPLSSSRPKISEKTSWADLGLKKCKQLRRNLICLCKSVLP